MRKICIAFGIVLAVLIAGLAPFCHIGVSAVAVKDGKVLVCKGSHDLPTVTLPIGKTPSMCAKQILSKETGLVPKAPPKISWSSNLMDPMDRNYINIYVEFDDFDIPDYLETYEWASTKQLDQISPLS